jgi:hypothetical protein
VQQIETENLFLLNPYPLSSSIYPSFQGIHSLTPLLQTFFHALNAPPVENAALHPGDMNEFIDLIDCSTDQTQGKGFHDEEFYFVGTKTTFVGDKTEFQGTAVRRSGEYEGKEGRGMDFLSEQGSFIAQDALAREKEPNSMEGTMEGIRGANLWNASRSPAFMAKSKSCNQSYSVC